MRALIVKTSSLGDVIHALPAVCDASALRPGIRFDWVVEEAFADVPALHGGVDRVIPVAIRRWRRQPLRAWRSGEWSAFRTALAGARYDQVIDAQGLIKSALLSRLIDAPRGGLDWKSAREPLASLAYDRAVPVPREMHAIERTRHLFALLLGYAVPDTPIDYGIDLQALHGAAPVRAAEALVFLHGTSRDDKCWPERHWQELCERAGRCGLKVLLPWGHALEQARAHRIALGAPHVTVLPRMSVRELAALMLDARALVAVDTGLGHLAAALGRPCVSLYGPTRVDLVGTRGANQAHVAVAADAGMATIKPEHVWQVLCGLVPLA
jgi:heptosyltransferase-1